MRVDKKVIQQIVFRPKPEGVFCGAKIDHNWYSFGVFKSEESFPLKEGQTVSFDFKQGTKFGEVDLKSVQVEQPQQEKKSYTKPVYKKKGSVPIQAGNARTAAFNFCKGQRKPVSEMKELITWFAEYGDNKRKEFSNNHKGMDDFEVGVSVGQSLTSAASVANSLEEVDEIVDEFLNQLIPHSIEIVTNLAGE